VEISSILDFDQGELLRLAISEFGELPKAKPRIKSQVESSSQEVLGKLL
jgi:hypothetical protein